MVRYLLDSVILIDHLNGVPGATDFLQEHCVDCAVSVITRAEVKAGGDTQSTRATHALLEAFVTLPVDADIADRAAVLRRKHSWKLPDALLAATALEAGLILVTRDFRAFVGARSPKVLIPYSVG